MSPAALGEQPPGTTDSPFELLSSRPEEVRVLVRVIGDRW